LVEVAGTRGENVTAAGRTTRPGKDGTTTQRGCMCGALVRCHDPRGVHHRRAEALEPFGGIPVTGDAGQDPDARAAMLGQAEAVITSRSGLGTPRWRSASAWAWPTVAATPEEPPVSHLPDAFRAAVVYELAG
jgi:hypothetical protein